MIAGILLTKLEPNAAGSGIPQLKAAYWKEMGFVRFRPVIVKFIAGLLTLGGGASLGREGPTVYMGGGIASTVAGATGAPKRARRGSALIGASAGLAAAFNTPLAAITFVLEEIVGDISSRSIGKVLLSSVIGAFVVYAFIGRQPAFSLPSVEQVSWIHYLVVPIVSFAASLLGLLFQRLALYWRGRFKHQKRIAPWLMPAFGGFVTWAIGSTVFLLTGKIGIFGLGYQDLSNILHNDFIWWIAGIMIIAKLVATVASYSTGGCGGIFSPLLFVGGACGFFIGGLVGLVIPLTPSDLIVLSAVGMSACLGTVVRAPLSAMLIVFEMTHQFTLVPGLLIGMFISMATTRLAGELNFYDALLVQDGHELHKIKPPQDLHGWQHLPCSAIANPNPVSATNVEASDLRSLIEKYPYQCFPLVVDGTLVGILKREDIVSSLESGAVPEYSQVSTCPPERTVRVVSQMLIEAPSGVVVVIDEVTGRVQGIVTLHDLLRAQAALLD